MLTAQQMQTLEDSLFAQGLPVAALMERAGWKIAERIQAYYPRPEFPKVGVLVGPGHNGGDALVVARELYLKGYQVQVCPVGLKRKELTEQQFTYYRSIGGFITTDYHELESVDVLIDGLFGIGITRALLTPYCEVIDWTYQVFKGAVVSIDLPSGLHSDTGAVLGTAIRATRTLALGHWKPAHFQDCVLAYLGAVELIDLDLPNQAVANVLPPIKTQTITAHLAQKSLPLNRSPTAHKYTSGKLLIVAGSRQYPGAALLAGLAAKASGVGLVAMAVPESIYELILPQLPDAVYYPCPETTAGTIESLAVDLSKFTAIATGPGLTKVPNLIQQLLTLPIPLLLDADALNSLAPLSPNALQRPSATLITPHVGEFRRLFPQFDPEERLGAARRAAEFSGATVILKGARTLIAQPDGTTWINPVSTPALARAGSGDVLTGLMGGLLAQTQEATSAAIGGVWWHSRSACTLVQERTVLGVDPLTLALYLNQTLQKILSE